MNNVDASHLRDHLVTVGGFTREEVERAGIFGHGQAVLYDENMDVKQLVKFFNLITDYGDEYYAKASVGALAVPTGMRLGTGATAPSKAGAGAAIVTYVAGSSLALDGAIANSDLGAGLGWRLTHVRTYAPGEATATGLNEVVITNETPITDVAGIAGNTLSRALLSPVVNKGAGDTLVVTWHHDFLGA